MHKHPRVRSRLRRNPRFHLHFIPTSSSWLNLVERWFRDLADKRIRRDSFQSVKQLEKAIYDFIDGHNDQPKSFVWTASAQEILENISRARAVLDKTSSE